ncbi:co-chaperone GroES [Photobacterium sp. OFAV2-7]|uniref:co-chaperone GroES n=1 Tax=Photobacterium sp. OFAV2-7 TaxID=2917748 RepID=UPI001EF6A8CD|nr:co-chaperone GroES [Photobacterium sp. OFAV2-7]MCG7587533.1 co-chaperone GroES [Photobacterium sp. OFAV2-7]
MHDWVVIERDTAKTEEQGFFIPSSPSNKGKVLAVGPLVKEVEPGDRIRFNPYAGLVVIGQRSATFIHEADIVGILTV